MAVAGGCAAQATQPGHAIPECHPYELLADARGNGVYLIVIAPVVFAALGVVAAHGGTKTATRGLPLAVAALAVLAYGWQSWEPPATIADWVFIPGAAALAVAGLLRLVSRSSRANAPARKG